MRKKQWTTFYGREFDLNEMSHQHLSNILYYYKIFLNATPDGDNSLVATEHVMAIKKEIDARFGGIQLPYYPLISFEYEIKGLIEMGYTTGEIGAPIVVNGKWIGEIKYQ